MLYKVHRMRISAARHCSEIRDSHILDKWSQDFVKGVTEGCMGHDTRLTTFAEESGPANSLGPVDDLAGNNKVLRTDFFAKRTDCTESEDTSNAKVLQSRNIGQRGH